MFAPELGVGAVVRERGGTRWVEGCEFIWDLKFLRIPALGSSIFFFFSFRLDWKWPSNESNFHSQRNVHRGGKIILESDLSTQIVIYIYISHPERIIHETKLKRFRFDVLNEFYIYIYPCYSCNSKFEEEIGKQIYDHLMTINFTSFTSFDYFHSEQLRSIEERWREWFLNVICP